MNNSLDLLNQGEQRRIINGISKRVFELAKRKEDQGNLYKSIHKDLKIQFSVESYKHIDSKRMQSVIKYIETWHP